jgi:hypothetical protein
MKFQHPEVEQFYQRLMALKLADLPEDERPVMALLDAYGWFRLIDGKQAEKLQEITCHLLSPDLRPALRSWYLRHPQANCNQSFIEFRDHLSALAGEKFGC